MKGSPYKNKSKSKDEVKSKSKDEVKWTEVSRKKVAPGSAMAKKGYTYAVTMKNNKGAGTKVLYR